MAYAPPATRTYLMTFNAVALNAVRDFVNAMHDVSFWYICTPNAIFYTSKTPAGEILRRMLQRFGQTTFFFITPLASEESVGWMPPQVWHMIANPEHPRLPVAGEKVPKFP